MKFKTTHSQKIQSHHSAMSNMKVNLISQWRIMPLAYYHPDGTSCVRFTNLEQLTCPRADVKGEGILLAFSQSPTFLT
jgi:hypothetical protein